MSGFWVLPDEILREMLKRVSLGEDPDMIYAEYYANSEVHTDGPDQL